MLDLLLDLLLTLLLNGTLLLLLQLLLTLLVSSALLLLQLLLALLFLNALLLQDLLLLQPAGRCARRRVRLRDLRRDSRTWQSLGCLLLESRLGDSGARLGSLRRHGLTWQRRGAGQCAAGAGQSLGCLLLESRLRDSGTRLGSLRRDGLTGQRLGTGQCTGGAREPLRSLLLDTRLRNARTRLARLRLGRLLTGKHSRAHRLGLALLKLGDRARRLSHRRHEVRPALLAGATDTPGDGTRATGNRRRVPALVDDPASGYAGSQGRGDRHVGDNACGPTIAAMLTTIELRRIDHIGRRADPGGRWRSKGSRQVVAVLIDHLYRRRGRGHPPGWRRRHVFAPQRRQCIVEEIGLSGTLEIDVFAVRGRGDIILDRIELRWRFQGRSQSCQATAGIAGMRALGIAAQVGPIGIG